MKSWSQSFSFVGTVLISGFLLVYLRSILVPFVLAVFLAYLVRPIAERVSACHCSPYTDIVTDEEARGLLSSGGDEGEEQDEGVPLGSKSVGELPTTPDPRKVMRSMRTALPRWVGMQRIAICSKTIQGVVAEGMVKHSTRLVALFSYRP